MRLRIDEVSKSAVLLNPAEAHIDCGRRVDATALGGSFTSRRKGKSMSHHESVSNHPIGVGGVAMLVVLFAVLLLTVVLAMVGWTSAGDTQMSIHGWIALGLGTVFSLVIGSGLMALMFYSSRSGYDEAVVVHVQDPREGSVGKR